MKEDNKYPGMNQSEFKILLNPEEFCKGDILNMDKTGNRLQVTKVYKYNWWRKLLVWMGYPRVKIFTGIKAKPINS